MTRDYTQLSDTHVTDDVLSAEEYDALVRILDSQVHGALEASGAGMVDGGVVAAGTGLSVTVTALKALASTANGMVYLQTDAAATVTGLPAGSTVYIHAAAVWRTISGDPDSREDASVSLFWSYTDAETDAVLLATVATGGASVSTVTDSRTWCPARAVGVLIAALTARVDVTEDDIAALKVVLGADYYDVNGDPVTGQDPVGDRLTALESGGGGGSIAYWGGLERSSGDRTTIPEYVASQVGAGGGGGGETGSGTTVTVKLPSDLEIANHARLTLRLMHALPEVEETQLFGYYFVPGISDDALYDAAATTAPVDKVNHRIG